MAKVSRVFLGLAFFAGFSLAAEKSTVSSSGSSSGTYTATPSTPGSKSREVFAPSDNGFDPDSALLLDLINKQSGYGGSNYGGGYGGSSYGGYGGSNFGGGYGRYGPYFLPWMNPLAFPSSFSNYGYANQAPVYPNPIYGPPMPQTAYAPAAAPAYTQPQYPPQPQYQVNYAPPSTPAYQPPPPAQYAYPQTAPTYQAPPPAQPSYAPAPPVTPPPTSTPAPSAQYAQSQQPPPSPTYAQAPTSYAGSAAAPAQQTSYVYPPSPPAPVSYPPAYPTGQAVSPVSYSTAAAPVSYVTQPAPVYSNYYPQPNGYASNFQDAYSYMYGLGSSYPYDIDIYNRDFSQILGSKLFAPRSKRSV